MATLGKRYKPPALTVTRPSVTRTIATPLRSPSVSQVSKVAVVTKQPVSAKPPATSVRPSTSVSSPVATPEKQLSLGRQKSSGGGGGGGGALPVDNIPAESPEEQALSEEQQAYYEQSSSAEVPVTSEGLFMMNSPQLAPVPKSVWQRIKDWFHDIFAGEEDISAPLTSVHIRDNVMHVASIVFNQGGARYVVTRIPCPAARGRNGSVQISGENPQWLESALQKAKYSIVDQTEKSADNRSIADVVERARAGDQNAYALIAMVRINAQKGNPRAIASARAMRDYMDKHPVDSTMGSELANVSDHTKKIQTAVVFANGKHLDRSVIRHFGSSFGEEAECFFQGAKDWNKKLSPNVARGADPYRLQVYEIGQVLGRARAIQQMRRPDVPVTSYDPIVGWELGE